MIVRKPYSTESIAAADVRISATCHPKQRDYVFDEGRRVSCLVGRGGGKTTGALLRLLRRMIGTVGANCLFVAATRDSAERLVWRDLKAICEKLRLAGTEFSESRLTLTLPNGSRLILTGCDDKRDIQRLRGITYHEVVVDETGSIKIDLLDELLIEVIGPRMIGAISLIGTPGKRLEGIFYDATRSGSDNHRPWVDRDRPEWADWTKWSSHKWTVMDGAAAGVAAMVEFLAIAKIEKANEGWTDSSPRWRREYLGEWAADDTSNVYVFIPYKEDGAAWNVWEPKLDAHGFAASPFDAKDTGYGIGIDVGWKDAFALTVFAFSYTDPRRQLYQVHEINLPRQYANTIAKMLIGEELSHDRYGGVIGRIGWPDVMVGDFAGSGGALLEELRIVYGITVTPADKALRLKENSIELMNSDLYDGRIKVIKGSILAEQLASLQWNVDAWGKRTENKGQANDQVDSALYCREAIQSLLPSASAEMPPSSSGTAPKLFEDDADIRPREPERGDADTMYQSEW